MLNYWALFQFHSGFSHFYLCNISSRFIFFTSSDQRIRCKTTDYHWLFHYMNSNLQILILKSVAWVKDIEDDVVIFIYRDIRLPPCHGSVIQLGNFPSNLLATPTSLTYSAHLCTQLPLTTCNQSSICAPVPHFRAIRPVSELTRPWFSWSWSQLSVPDSRFRPSPCWFLFAH